MSIPGSASPLFLASTAAAGAYDIPRSLRFNSGDSAYLSRTPSSAGNRRTWTWSGWVKRSKLNVHQDLFTAGGSTSQPRTRFRFQSNNIISIGFNPTGSLWYLITTSSAYRDTSAWCHIVLVCDTTQSTSSDRLKLYVNGVLQSFGTASYVPQNTQTTINNNTYPHSIGREQSTAGNYFDGYLADVHFIDGQALAATDFGEYDDNNVWQPKKFAGTYGTNGFKLDFSDTSSNAALGTDSSGNGNTWTVNNLSVAAGAGNDALRDSPVNGDSADDTGAGGEITGNYATLNPNITGTYISSRTTLSNGNLKFVNTQYSTLPSTIAMSSGKWYCEGTLDALASASNQVWAGLLRTDAPNDAYEYFQLNNPTRGVHFWGDNTGLNRAQSYGASYATAGTVIGIAFDADAGSCTWYINGSSQGASTYNIVQGEEYYFSFGAYTNGAWTVNFGQRAFAYTAPSGYKALCTANLPDPTIADGSTAFDTKLYTGNGTDNRAITGYNFSPDLVWIKTRNNPYSHQLYDSVRGAGSAYNLQSDNTSAEGANASKYGFLASFTSDGFTLGNGSTSNIWTNQSSHSYLGWTWDAGSSTVTNTDGSISAQVRANPSAGFSIVSYTGTGSAATVGHGLNAAPEMIILKDRNAVAKWKVLHVGAVSGADAYYQNVLHLDTNESFTGTGNTYPWGGTAPTSSVFSVANASTEANRSGSINNTNYIAYCFAPVEGYSAFGSYTGNGIADGPFVYTGFKPSWVMFKSSTETSTGATGWHIFDAARLGYNGSATNKGLRADTSAAEVNPGDMDILSNGFKLRNNNGGLNTSAATYIYAAFAEHPFKTSRAR